MFEFNLYHELSYHSLFNNMSCILYNYDFNLSNIYNFNHYSLPNFIIYENYYLISKYFWINQILNLNYLYFFSDTNIYSINLWLYNFLSIINYYMKFNIILINNYQKNISWINFNDNLIIKYYIINNELPRVSNNFQIVNIFVDHNIFPYKNKSELYFFYKKLCIDYIYLDSIENLNPLNANEYVRYIQVLMKANIINYLILNNNYLLPFFLNNDWYYWNFLKGEFLYKTLPFYWDYDYILGFFKYFEVTDLIKNDYYLNNNIIYDYKYLKINDIFIPNYKYKYLIDHFINQNPINYWLIKSLLMLIYIYISIYKIYYIYLHIINFINWYLNILTFCIQMKIQDYIFYYFFNPLYLYFGKNMREIVYWYCNIINKKNLNLMKNKKDCESNIIIFYYDFVYNSYIKYLTFLLISIIIKYIFIIFYISIYNIKFIFKLNLFSLNYYNYLIIYIKYIKYILVINLNYIINVKIYKSLWTKINYIFMELFNFSHQNKLVSNNIIISIINWLNYNEFNIFNFKIIHNKLEYSNIKWKTWFTFINLKNLYIYWFNFNFIIKNCIVLIKLLYYDYINIIKIKNLLYLKMNIKNYTFNLKVNIFFYIIGFLCYIIIDYLIYLITFIYKFSVKIIIKLKYIYILILLLSLIFFFNFNIKLILWPVEIFLMVEVPWINEILYWFYNKYYFFNLEWIIYEKNYIIETINIKTDFLKLKENIWNDIFVHFNFQKKKWQDVTSDKIWKFINPIYLFIFLVYEFKIQFFISEFFNYFITTIILNLLFKYMPFLYWYNLNISYWYVLNYIKFNIYFGLYILKCYYTYIYIFLLCNLINIKISIYIFKYMYILIYIKYWYFYIYYLLINMIINDLIILNKKIINLLLLYFSILIYICEITNTKKFISIIIFILIESINKLIFNFYKIENIYIEYINIFIFLNLYIEIQNNLDIINSYIRINKYKIYKWNKFSKRKKNFRYFIKNFLIEYFYALTYENHIISLSTLIHDNSFSRINVINYWFNINIYIKYWYWIKTNYFNLAILGYGDNYYWHKDFDFYDFENYHQEDYIFNLLYKYCYIWNDLIYIINKNNYSEIYLYYMDQFEMFYKTIFNLGYLNLRIFINYIFIYFFNSFIIFMLIWQINIKKNFDIYNLDYLWQNFKIIEEKNEFNNFTSKLNHWFKIVIKRTKINKNAKFNILLKFYNNLYNNLYNINNINNSNNYKNIYKNIYIVELTKFIKLFLNSKFNIKIKIMYSFNFYIKFKFKNNLINLINMSYKDIYNRHSELLYLLISYLYKKNIFAYYINKQELYKIIIPLNKKFYILNINNIKIQKNVNIYIIQFFNNLELFLFNNRAPNWLLNKNNSTIFYNFSINDKKEILDLTLIFPYEIIFFFFIIIYIYIYYKIILYNIIWSQRLWLGSTIFEKREWIHILIYNNIFINYIKILNWIESNKSSFLNTNSPIGLELQQFTNIFINTNKFYYFNKLFKYKNNLNLNNLIYYFKIEDDFLNNLLKNIYLWKIIIINLNFWIIYYILGYKVIYKLYIKMLIYRIKNIKKLKLNKFNFKKLRYIYFHYKFKKMLWNNYIFKNI